MTTIAVLGLMGVGKSTVGGLVAVRLHCSIVDSDDWIEGHYGMTGRAVAEKQGVDALHDIEAEMLGDVLDAGGQVVVTPAASVIDRPELRERIRTETTAFHLDLPYDQLEVRMATGPHRRTVDSDEMHQLYRRRRPLFDGVSLATLDASEPPALLAELIVGLTRAGASSSGVDFGRQGPDISILGLETRRPR